MAACELKRNYATRYCLFGIDGKNDLSMLPTSTRKGSGDLIRSTTCCIGSMARASNGKVYVLTGENKWIEYIRSDGGGGGGGDGVDDITEEDVEELFD